MPTTTNYGWTTPADTDLVKDGASAIRTLGTSIDTTTKALNPSTTLGDIEYRSSTANTNTRLGIGTTGQVLAVSGGVPAWTTLTVASGLTVVKSATTFTNVANTGTTFDSVFSSTYDSYMVVINKIFAATDTDDLLLTFLTSGTEITSSYFGGRLSINYSGTTNNAGINGGTFATLSICSGETGYEGSAVLYFNNVGGRMNFHGTMHTGENEDGLGLVSFTNFNSNTYTGFRLKSASSNITGTVTVYGLAKS